MKDYEQLYYDALYEIKELKKKIEDLESDLSAIKKIDKNKLNLKKEIVRQLNLYKERK